MSVFEQVRAALDEHYWSAGDDETCGCGWIAETWRATDDDADGLAAMEAAHYDFVSHQTYRVLAALGHGELS